MTTDEALAVIASIWRGDGMTITPRMITERVLGATALAVGSSFHWLIQAGLLRSVFTYYDVDDNAFELSSEEEQAVLDGEDFAHPDYGYLVRDAAASCRRTYMLTEAGEKAVAAIRHAPKPFDSADYMKCEYIALVDGKEVSCWPNAGLLNAIDGSGRTFGPGTMCRVSGKEGM